MRVQATDCELAVRGTQRLGECALVLLLIEGLKVTWQKCLAATKATKGIDVSVRRPAFCQPVMHPKSFFQFQPEVVLFNRTVDGLGVWTTGRLDDWTTGLEFTDSRVHIVP